MPTIYIKKELYDAIVKSGKDPNTFVNDTVKAALKLTAIKKPGKIGGDSQTHA